MSNKLKFNYLFSIIALLAFFCSPVSLHAADTIKNLSISTGENGSQIVTFHTNAPVEIGKAFLLHNPERLVIDIPTVTARGLILPKNYDRSLMKVVRFGQFDSETSRIVLELNAPVKIIQTTSGSPFSVEIAAITSKANAAPAAAKTPPPPKKPMIVIDAGHGGHDPGALGLHNTHEKDVTLNFAKALRDKLLQTGRYQVSLTRKDDTFIPLQERVTIARKAKGDLFISFHADSNPRPEARGLSIYTVSETASDDEAAALAERENKADIIPGINLNTTDADVANILIDLTQRETMNKAAIFADLIVNSLHKSINKLPKTHRFAGFRVLKAPDIPSVLIELGFVSNEADERLLLSPDYRDTVVESVVKGIDRFHAGE